MFQHPLGDLMARPRTPSSFPTFAPPQLVSWAESLGEALGRGVARGLNSGLSTLNLGKAAGPVPGAARRGRPPKLQLASGPVPADKQCKEPGCTRQARSKGLCSAHYQAERRRILLKGKA
jgi:hypothetical protein